ncbi:MAG: phosphatidylglycerophosphatase A [Burkholderiales bacterium]|nr:phosphatidylglycerophosphatase A [Burkholderiales bacterium]GIK85447.1 MAG: phosphatidylglycerophosphatase A [Betaproteobacteria bacterium]
MAMAAPALTFRFFLSHPAHFVALGFGTGLAPWAPGTVATLFAIPLGDWLAVTTTDAGYLAAVAVLFAVGVWAAERTGRDLGVPDHGGIVIDEIVAFLLVMYFAGTSLERVALGFLLFRLFDIAKPPPIRAIDARMKSGLGVMLDDLVAAAMALVAFAVIVRVTGWPA